MSTHAAIIQATADGDYRGIYLHHDGYTSHAGRILKEHYASDEAVAALIDLGDLSALGATLEQTFAYHRDRGEEKHIRASKDLAWVADKIDWDYLYLWEGGEWQTFTRRDFSEALEEIQRWEIERAESEAGWDATP